MVGIALLEVPRRVSSSVHPEARHQASNPACLLMVPMGCYLWREVLPQSALVKGEEALPEPGARVHTWQALPEQRMQ